MARCPGWLVVMGVTAADQPSRTPAVVRLGVVVLGIALDLDLVPGKARTELLDRGGYRQRRAGTHKVDDHLVDIGPQAAVLLGWRPVDPHALPSMRCL